MMMWRAVAMMLSLGVATTSHAQSVPSAAEQPPIAAPPAMQFVVLDKDFTKYDTPKRKTPGSENQIEIIYFFWYGSPWSYQIDRQLRQWVSAQSYPIRFTAAPVSFGNPYEIFAARVFFTLQFLGEEERLGSLFFEAVQKKYVDLTKPQSVTAWMVARGVDGETFVKTLNSPQVKSMTATVPYTMNAYDIKSVPTVVIDGQYQVRAHGKNSPQHVLETVRFMTERLSQGGARP